MRSAVVKTRTRNQTGEFQMRYEKINPIEPEQTAMEVSTFQSRFSSRENCRFRFSGRLTLNLFSGCPMFGVTMPADPPSVQINSYVIEGWKTNIITRGEALFFF